MKDDIFLNNGYYEAKGYAPGDDEESEPVMISVMLPSQGLQPHSHDIDEVLHLG